MAGVSWVDYIANLIRRGNEAAVSEAWVQVQKEYGYEGRLMYQLAQMRAREAEQAGEPVQAALW
jgi:hypothetical protein